jgi:hypothetical protein
MTTDLERLAELGRPVEEGQKYEAWVCLHPAIYPSAICQQDLADAALAERMKSELELAEERDEARELVDLYDSALRSACRKWAACCDQSVMYPPRIRVAGDGWQVVWDEALARPTAGGEVDDD